MSGPGDPEAGALGRPVARLTRDLLAGRVRGVPTEYLLQVPTVARIYNPSVLPLLAKGRAHSSHYLFTRGVRNNWGRFFRSVKEAASLTLATSGTIFEQIVPSGHSRPRPTNRLERPHAARTVSPARRKTFALPIPLRNLPEGAECGFSAKNKQRKRKKGRKWGFSVKN